MRTRGRPMPLSGGGHHHHHGGGGRRGGGWLPGWMPGPGWGGSELVVVEQPQTTCPVIDKRGRVVNHVNCPPGSPPIMLSGLGDIITGVPDIALFAGAALAAWFLLTR